MPIVFLFSACAARPLLAQVLIQPNAVAVAPSNAAAPLAPVIALPPVPSAQLNSTRQPAATDSTATDTPPAAAPPLQNDVGMLTSDDGWTVNFRVAWGGGSEQQWKAELTWSAGPIALRRALGIEADEPGSMWIGDGALRISQRGMRAYDGVDLRVPYDPEAKLTYRFQANDGELITGEVPLADLLNTSWQRPLDERGNRLFIRRMPGDAMRVRCERQTLVFSPGENWAFEVTPHLLPLGDNTSVRIKPRLIAQATGKEVWTQEFLINKWTRDWSRPVQAGMSQPAIPFECPLPEQEGVYELTIEATERGPLRWGKPLLTRTVQLISVAEQRQRPRGDTGQTSWAKVHEIDPTNNSWSEKFRAGWSLWPGSRPGPLGNGHGTAVTVDKWGSYLRIGNGPKPEELGWEAFPLVIGQPGMPHILEVDYPTHFAQTLGISIVEPNAAGQVQPIGVDSGIIVTAATATARPGWAKHRLVFWPRTKMPLVLFTNRSEPGTAAVGKFRVLAGPAHLPPADDARNWNAGERQFAAVWTRPLFPENFSAAETLDAWSGRTLDDWQTFAEGAGRMVEYARYAGHNAIVLAAYADGSTIYPSRYLEPTPRYDTGVFLDAGHDLYRKDALELVYRLCDREGMRLLAGMQFAAPLPELEQLLRDDPTTAEGIRLIGANGRPWHEQHAPRRGLAPYYNPLDERVQTAILRAVGELAARYGQHPAFAGISLELTADGYLQFPGEFWGLDDRTVARFCAETGQTLPREGTDRHWQRAKYLAENDPIRQRWLAWRAAKLKSFYARLETEVTAARPDARFVLLPTNPWDSPELQSELPPSLTVRRSWSELQAKLGWSGAEHGAAGLTNGAAGVANQRQAGIWLWGARQTRPGPLVSQAGDRELERTAEAGDERGASFVGAMLYHEPQRLRLPSFDAKSPFGKDKTFTWQATQFAPAGAANRRRFVLALAQRDCEWFCDGGWMPPLGQEESLQDLSAAFRRLPAERFETLPGELEPVTLRTLTRDGRTWFYAVNTAPWPVKVQLQVNAVHGVRPLELSGWRNVAAVQGKTWTVELGAYDFLAVRFPGTVSFGEPRLTLPETLESELTARLAELRTRRGTLENPPPLVAVANADFEQVDRAGRPLGWQLLVSNVDSGALVSDEVQPKHGNRAAKLSSRSAQGITFQSDSITAPRTGRLAISVWLRVAHPENQPAVRLAVAGTWREEEYYRYAPVGAGPGLAPLRSQWSQYILQVDDLPAEGIAQLRVRIDIEGAGEVWVDDLQVFDLAFAEQERRQLDKLLALADFQLQNGKLGRCWTDLEGYWPSYLMELVPLPPPVAPAALVEPLVTPPTYSAPPTDEKQVTKPGVWERMREWWR